MKIHLFRLIPGIIVLFVTGCTSTYVKKDFSSDEAFFNKISKNYGSAGLTMENDSIVSANDPKVVKDSIKWEKTEYKFAFDPNSKSVKKYAVPLNEVTAVTFTHHWGGNILTGMFSGMVTGSVLGAALIQVDVGHGFAGFDSDPILEIVPGALAGILLGGIVGIIVGEDDLYIMDNSYSGLDHFNKYSGHKFGLKLGRHSGFNNDLIMQESHNSDFTKLLSNGIPGAMITLYYNYPFSQLFSFNSELSFASIGSDTRFSVEIPNMKNNDTGYSYNSYGISSNEYMKVLELAAVTRLNLFRSNFTPYILLGPRFDFLFPDESDINNFLVNLHNQVNTQGIGLSSGYNRFTAGVTFGGGFSTGKMFPVELLVEARYNYDFTPRFKIHYDIPSDMHFMFLYYDGSGNQLMKYRSSEFQINIGAAIF